MDTGIECPGSASTGRGHPGGGAAAVCARNDPRQLPGRVLRHYGSGKTRRAEGLSAACPEPLVEVSPNDAARLGLCDGATVRLLSRRGAVVSRAAVTDRVGPGCVVGNFHFPAGGNINNATTAAADPVSMTPAFKVCAVAVKTLGGGDNGG